MKPELVLTEEDKKRRFKKFLKKKEKEEQQEGPGRLMELEPDLPPLEPIQSSVCSFLTPSFRQNIQLLFNRSPSGLQQTYLEEKLKVVDGWNNSEEFNNNFQDEREERESSLVPPPQFNFLSSLQYEREELAAPLDYSNSIKDMEALKYFSSHRQISTLVSPNMGQKYLVSPNQAELFVSPPRAGLEEEAQDYSVPKTERRSVITFPRVKVKAEEGHGYLHKKFRSHHEDVELHSSGEELERRNDQSSQLSRESVILHSSSANKICTI